MKVCLLCLETTLLYTIFKPITQIVICISVVTRHVFIINISLTSFNGAKITLNSLYNKLISEMMSLLKPLFFSITWQMNKWMSEYFNEHICFNSKSSFASPSFHKLFNIMMLIKQHENQDIVITLRK